MCQKADEMLQLSRIGSQLRALQRAIDEVRTLPLTPPQRVAQKANCRLKTNFLIFP